VVRACFDGLEDADSKCSCFARAGLRLCNRVLALDDWENGLLLDGGWVPETIAVDAAEDFFFEAHVVELVNFQIPVCFKRLFTFLSTFF